MNIYRLKEISPVPSNRKVHAICTYKDEEMDKYVIERVPILHFGLFEEIIEGYNDSSNIEIYYKPIDPRSDMIEESEDITRAEGYLGLEFDDEEEDWNERIEQFKEHLLRIKKLKVEKDKINKEKVK